MDKVLTAHVVGRKDLTGDLFILWLEPKTKEKFSFKPGQYCTIGLSDEEGNFMLDSRGKRLLRAYSIVSAPHEEHLELFVELVPDGELTPLLHRLRIGDSVNLLPKPKGVFTFEPHYKNHVMIATVTGVVPFVSIIRDYLHRGMSGHRFFVLHGASYYDEFAYYRELCRVIIYRPSEIALIYVPTVSRPREERNRLWYGSCERVNLIVEKHLDCWNLSMEDSLIYVCGHPGMIEDVKARLLPKGWKVKEERFWK